MDCSPRAGSDDLTFPVSFSQQRLWVLHQFDAESGAYNRPTNFRLSGPLDTAVLERSLGEIVARHESLRTRFPAVDGEPVQQIDPPGKLPLGIVDLSDLPEPERAARSTQLVREATRQPLDLETEWPLRCTLVRLTGGEHLLLAFLQVPESPAGSVLRQHGVSREGLLAALKEHRANRPS